jgi:hypothetical protein
MRESPSTSPAVPVPVLNAVLLVAALGLFALDLSIPHGYTIWILYLPLCVGAAWISRPRLRRPHRPRQRTAGAGGFGVLRGGGTRGAAVY